MTNTDTQIHVHGILSLRDNGGKEMQSFSTNILFLAEQKSRITFWIIGAILLTVSCLGCNDMEVKHIAGDFYLTNVERIKYEWDLSEKISQGSYIGVINASVLAIGYSEDYILVKQHPHLRFNDFYADEIRYYIIPLKYRIHEWAENNYIGPLKEKDFLEKRKELTIPDDVDFSIVIEKIKE